MAGRLASSLGSLRMSAFGLALFVCGWPGAPHKPALVAIAAVGEGVLVCGALLAIARQSGEKGLLPRARSAGSLDALYVAATVWSSLALVLLLRAFAPDVLMIDPLALSVAAVFASAGSILLMLATLLRARVLRGLELSLFDRTSAALALALAALAVVVAATILGLASQDRLLEGAAVFSAASAAYATGAPSAAQVTRSVRALLVLVAFGSPIMLGGAWLIQRTPEQAVQFSVLIAGLSLLCGLTARAAAQPFAPVGDRWLQALQSALEAANHPQPDLALAHTLRELRRAEPKSKSRPEIFRADPAALLAVDVAGYLGEQPAEFPQAIFDMAAKEECHTLRAEVLKEAQVRRPEVRAMASWFEAHRAGTATAVTDETECMGLLVLPQGKRRRYLSMEEADLLQQLARRLAGILNVTSQLRRATQREQQHARVAEQAGTKMQQLEHQLRTRKQDDRSLAQFLARKIQTTGHSAGAAAKLIELEAQGGASTLRLVYPLGVDPVPWAAHAHLSQRAGEPFVVVDLSGGEEPIDWLHPSSPLKRATTGTLVLLLGQGSASQDLQSCARAVNECPPAALFLCETLRRVDTARSEAALSASFERAGAVPTAVIELPGLAQRAEDLQGLVLSHLVQLGEAHRGQPLGIEPSALQLLIDRPLWGNEAELWGLLTAAVAIAPGTRITTEDVQRVLQDEPAEDTVNETGRRRARMAPRARRTD